MKVGTEWKYLYRAVEEIGRFEEVAGPGDMLVMDPSITDLQFVSGLKLPSDTRFVSVGLRVLAEPKEFEGRPLGGVLEYTDLKNYERSSWSWVSEKHAGPNADH